MAYTCATDSLTAARLIKKAKVSLARRVIVLLATCKRCNGLLNSDFCIGNASHYAIVMKPDQIPLQKNYWAFGDWHPHPRRHHRYAKDRCHPRRFVVSQTLSSIHMNISVTSWSFMNLSPGDLSIQKELLKAASGVTPLIQMPFKSSKRDQRLHTTLRLLI